MVLDENVLESQRLALLSRGVHLCQIGYDAGRKGMQDDEIVALLRRIRRSTFFSRDRDFHQRSLCSDRYCLAQVNVGPLAVADQIRRFLRHLNFRTWALRRGCVVRLSPTGISPWRPGAARAVRYRWTNTR